MEFVAHYHTERNHQGLGNVLLKGAPANENGRVHRHERLGALLNYYHRVATCVVLDRILGHDGMRNIARQQGHVLS